MHTFFPTQVVGTCTEKITKALDPKEIEVKGMYDDPNGSHITIYCVADAFEGKRSLARQQMVFKVRSRHSPHATAAHRARLSPAPRRSSCSAMASRSADHLG